MKTFKEIYDERRTIVLEYEYNEKYEGYYALTADNKYISWYNAQDHNIPVKRKDGDYDIFSSTYTIRYERGKAIKTEIDNEIVGTALAFTTTLWEFVLCNGAIWTWFVGLVTDGYFMIFFSPFILAYWALLLVVYIPLLPLLSALVVASLVWTVIMEVPAAFMNKELTNKKEAIQ